MRFYAESEMAKPVARWFRQREFYTKLEFKTPWGICDVVACRLHATNAAHRLRIGQYDAIGSALSVALLLQVPDEESGRSTTLSKLKEQNHFLPGALVERELKRLKDKGFVVHNRRQRLQKRNGWIPLHRKLVAVELKLSRVQDALAQAKCNLALADESGLGHAGFPRVDVLRRRTFFFRTPASSR